MKCRALVISALIVLALLPARTPAGPVTVRLNNQNLSVDFTDAAISDDLQDHMRIERVYNSMATFSGLFGVGWGSEPDSYVLARPDNKLQYYFYGGGAARTLTSYTLALSGSSSDIITAAAVKEGLVESADEYRGFEQAGDITQEDLYQSMLGNGYLEPPRIAVGETFWGQIYGPVRVIRVEDGYQLAAPGAGTQEDPFEGLFDEQGRLIRTWAYGNPQRFVSYRYGTYRKACDGQRRLLAMRDYRGYAFRFSYDCGGRVTKIDGGRLGIARYRYDNAANLVWSRDMSGRVSTYSYDDNNDLTRITYTDRAPEMFQYPAHNGRLTALQCSDGTKYTFTPTRDSSGHTTSMRVTRTQAGETTTYTYAEDELGGYTYC